jgi:trigger factor
VNVTVENLAPCKKLVRVEVELEKVDEAFNTVARGYQKEAALPGFRPGKAPLPMVLRKYEKDILDETKRKLISDSYKKAVDEQNLDVIGYPDIEEVQFGRGQTLLFNATVETAPEFELPEYKGLPAKAESRTVTDQDLQRALDLLREQHISFNKVERAAQLGDIAVVNYVGTCEGKPITEIAPTAKGLTEKQNFWVEIGGQSFIPGFGEQLVGALAGEKRTVQVNFPADFVTPQLAGKLGVYETEVVEVKEKVLPPLDDALAKLFGAENVDKLREGVQRDLQNELEYKRNRTVRNQLMRGLMDRLNFELPESSVAQETRNVVYEIVNENTKRGVPRNAIEENKDQIYTAAASGAKERLKANFLLRKIAEKEDIKVSQEEILQRISTLAVMYKIPAEQFLKDLQKRNGIMQIFDQVMNEKVMDLLQKEAKIEEVPPGTLFPEASTPQT